jgi:hypothetical protein
MLSITSPPLRVIILLLAAYQACVIRELLEEEAARQGRLANRRDFLVDPGRGIRKVQEWINHRNEEVCVNAVGMTAKNFR